ncbi:MAG: hypothetical protein ACTSPE_12900 [Candidatus Thorarchaeota archaeon]
MTKSMIYNSRLFPPEFGKWLEMCSHAGLDTSDEIRECVESFGELADAMLYLTTLDGEAVGGTAVYRDRRRLGLALVSVVMSEEHRERLLRSMIKSSLPFFRTSSIRDVDALVAADDQLRLPFPYDFVLPPWTREPLTSLGFVSTNRMLYSEFPGVFYTEGDISLQQVRDPEEVRAFLWAQRNTTSVDASHIWLALDLAVSRAGAFSVQVERTPKMVICGDSISDTLVVRVLAWDREAIDVSEVAAAVVTLAQRDHYETVRVEVGPHGREVLDVLAALTDSADGPYQVEILRKTL